MAGVGQAAEVLLFRQKDSKPFLGFLVFEEKFSSGIGVISNACKGIWNVEEVDAILLHKGAALARMRSLR